MADNNSRTLTANFTADTSGFSPKINELVQKLKSANQEFEQNKTKITALKTEMKNYQKELQSLEKEQKNGTTLTAEQKQRMQELRERIAACATQIGTYNSAQRQLTSDMNSLNRQLSEARDAFSGTGQAASTFGEVLKANIASEAILGALRKIVDGLRKAAAYCYSTGSAFEAGMSKVAAVSGASADDLARLTEKAKDLGASTKFTATETAEAMNYMAMAGWKTEEMLSGIDGVLGLAAASGSDLATTSDIVTDAITAFGLKADDCAHFADVLAAASANANTNVALMGETFKYCAASAGAFKFSAEDTVTAIGLMASGGIKGSQAGTATRKFLSELSKDVTLTSDNFGELTIKTSNLDGTMRPLLDIVKDLRDAFAKMKDNERTAAAENLVGAYASTGFVTMMTASEESLEKLTDAIQNCDGAAANMAETMEQNVQGAVTKMNSALEAVGNEVYDKFKDSLLDTVNIFTDMLGDLKDDVENGGLGESIEDLGESFKKLATGGAQVAKDVLPTLVNILSRVINVVSVLTPVIGSAVKAFLTFQGVKAAGSIITGIGKTFVTLAANIKTAGGAMNALKAAFATNPFGMIATAASVAVGAVSLITSSINNASESAEELREKCETLAQQTAEYKQECDDLKDIKKQYEDIYNAVDPDVDKTKELKDLQEQLKTQFPELAKKIDLVKESYSGVVSALDDVIDKTSKAYKIQAEGSLSAAQKKEEEIATEVKINGYSELGMDAVYAVEDYLKSKRKGFLGLQEELWLEFDGSYEERLKKMSELRDKLLSLDNGKYERSQLVIDLSSEIGAVQKLKEELEAAEVEVNNLKNSQTSSGGSGTTAWREREYMEQYKREQAQKAAEEKAREKARAEQLKAQKELYDKEKQLADDRYSVGEISEANYYATLTALRDKYLEAQTHDWYVATAKIKGYQDQNLKSQKSSLSETELAYKKTLAAIDAEIERHKRAKSDKEYEQKLADIDDRMKYDRLDEFERYELEKERKKLQEEREEELFSRDASDAKSAATDAYNAQKALEKASENTKEYTLALGDYTDALANLSGVLKGVSQTFTVNGGGGSSVTNLDQSTKNQYNNVVLQAVNRSNDQIVNRLLKALTSKL